MNRIISIRSLTAFNYFCVYFLGRYGIYSIFHHMLYQKCSYCYSRPSVLRTKHNLVILFLFYKGQYLKLHATSNYYNVFELRDPLYEGTASNSRGSIKGSIERVSRILCSAPGSHILMVGWFRGLLRICSGNRCPVELKN